MKAYLLSRAAEMGVNMTDEQAEKLIAYHEMLVSANREMNLTRVDEDFREAADRNYLDSLTVLEHLGDARTLIDVGTGAGLPGIPIAILKPDLSVTLLDALSKRVSFLQRVVEALDLNVQCVHGRAEDAAKRSEFRDAFDISTARAVAEMNVLSEWLLPFVKPGGKMLALKGPMAEEETERAKNALEKLNAEKVSVHDAPLLWRDWNHKIVEIRKTGPTPEAFPRRAGVAEKRPL